MSDDEEMEAVYVKRQKTIHYGSLEASERQKLAKPEEPTTVPVKNETPQVHTSTEFFDLEAEMAKDKTALLEEFERKKKARHVQVSTDDNEIKRKLRELGEPICYFGEGPFERRTRLKELLSAIGETSGKKGGEEDDKKRSGEQEGTWYHEGPETLRTARLWIAYYSLPRAKERLQQAKQLKELPSAVKAGRTVELQKKVQSLALQSSQVADTRPINASRFNDDGTLLLTGSWTGVAKVWSVPDCALKQELKGHQLNIGGVAFRPKTNIDSVSEATMATSSADGMVKLWSFDSEESIADITGHVPHRVSRLEFHPSGRFLGTACYDNSWRLWDLEQKQEVLHQEGHSKSVHCISFQCDGSVAATGGLDTFGRVWDLRTGRCVMFLEGHLGAIYGVCFSPNGFNLVTGGGDNTAKIWDLRRRQIVYTIPAHTNIVSDVKFEKHEGNFLVTASYDNTAKVSI